MSKQSEILEILLNKLRLCGLKVDIEEDDWFFVKIKYKNKEDYFDLEYRIHILRRNHSVFKIVNILVSDIHKVLNERSQYKFMSNHTKYSLGRYINLKNNKYHGR